MPMRCRSTALFFSSAAVAVLGTGVLAGHRVGCWRLPRCWVGPMSSWRRLRAAQRRDFARRGWAGAGDSVPGRLGWAPCVPVVPCGVSPPRTPLGWVLFIACIALSFWWYRWRVARAQRDAQAGHPTASFPPPGAADWYPDQYDPTLMRYFDGQNWTSMTKPRG